MNNRRILDIENLDNLRDLGGYVTIDKKTTKYNVFLRSESLLDISTQDIVRLQQIGIANCIDLHGNLYGETQKHPAINSGINYYCFPILSNFIKHTGTVRDKFTPSDWIKVNIDLLENHKQWIYDVIKTCSITECGTVIHCRTGKSRTSLIVMLLLLIAKVPPVDIVADFAVTEIYMKEKYRELYRKSFHSWGFYSSADFIMEKTIAYLLSVYKSIDQYLFSCGITQNEMNKIKQKFIVD